MLYWVAWAADGMARGSARLKPRVRLGYRLTWARTVQLWENEYLEAFPIFPSGVRYRPRKIRDKAKFPIFLQNFLEDKSTPNLACKTDDVFPKSRRILS
ncbi:hypothetical protein DVH24_037885 [Malus domestica]|uniref:Uncharacterized protein n=1 Tax=Malus domestica TaxID=3750 RepID=A0A498JZ22_MALDO|nr:hypothetical protein DVH24_037885 [Malus domestica]